MNGPFLAAAALGGYPSIVKKHHDNILRKPVPRWPDRHSYASHKRQKGGKR